MLEHSKYCKRNIAHWWLRDEYVDEYFRTSSETNEYRMQSEVGRCSSLDNNLVIKVYIFMVRGCPKAGGNGGDRRWRKGRYVWSTNTKITTRVRAMENRAGVGVL